MQGLFELAREYGLGLVFVNVLAEQLGAPVPALPTLVVTGALAAGSGHELFVLVGVAYVACLTGDCAWYLAGRRYGYRVLRTLCRISLNQDRCVTRTESLYMRWGAASLIMAKFIPGYSTVAPPLAGALGVGPMRFLWYDSLGALAWIVPGVGGGFLFHRQIDTVLSAFESMGLGALVILAAVLAAVVLLKWRSRRRMIDQFRMTRISVQELRQLLDDGHEPTIIDVRSAAARVADPRRIPGAIAIDPAELDAYLGELPKERELIVYCNCPNEASAAALSSELKRRGYRQVRPLSGGLDAWDAISRSPG